MYICSGLLNRNEAKKDAAQERQIKYWHIQLILFEDVWILSSVSFYFYLYYLDNRLYTEILGLLSVCENNTVATYFSAEDDAPGDQQWLLHE